MHELDFRFSIIGISETRITNANSEGLNFNYDIPGYAFEYVPTPLSAGGVGMYIRDDYKYFVIEKMSEQAFQALWIEIFVPGKKNIICCVLYRQHNNPDCFLKYFDDKIEFFTVEFGDTNIDVFKRNYCNFARLLSFFTKQFYVTKY